jgi:predicted TIM-barrel fold metal-dependent hydrolase
VAGREGNSLGRGTQNGLALLSVLHAGVLERLPDLHLVFTSLGNGALYFAADRIAALRDSSGEAPQLYLDTTRFNPALIRYYADLLGVERIVVGTDWPGRDTTRDQTEGTLVEAGLDEAQRALVAGGNARRLFGLRATRSTAAA